MKSQIEIENTDLIHEGANDIEIVCPKEKVEISTSPKRREKFLVANCLKKPLLKQNRMRNHVLMD